MRLNNQIVKNKIYFIKGDSNPNDKYVLSERAV